MCRLFHRWGAGGLLRWPLGAALAATMLFVGCASPPVVAQGGSRTLLLYGDGRPESVLAFPDVAYEALIRFDLEPKANAPLRLWYRPSAAGSLQISVYESSGLDGPGVLLSESRRDIAQHEAGDAKSGRWIVEELPTQKLGGQTTLWVGFKKVAGTPGLWSSDKDGGHYYMRSLDPARRVPLLPVRRAPVVQLEFDTAAVP
jgi:hypothetical protein